MELREVKRLVEEGLAAFRTLDLYLLQHDLREESISARLAFHLQAAFADAKYVVDVEYNRLGEKDDPKRLANLERCAKRFDRHGRAIVLPDIIVHRRGPDDPNLLVLELKKTSNPLGSDCDRTRLKGFQSELGYSFGALVECQTSKGKDPSIGVIEWIPDDGAPYYESSPAGLDCE